MDTNLSRSAILGSGAGGIGDALQTHLIDSHDNIALEFFATAPRP